MQIAFFPMGKPSNPCDSGSMVLRINQVARTFDLPGLIENLQGAARAQVDYLVDMAKSDALDLLGETRQAWELVDRHV